MKNLKIPGGYWLAALALLTGLETAAAQNTVFTYQGRVLDNGTNFNGPGQFQFALVTSTNNSHTAVATANLSGAFITSYNVTFGGSGYVTAPVVTITGGGGTGATATANLTGGVVTSLTPGSAGSGYTTTATVNIAPPPVNIFRTTDWSNDGTSVNGSEPAAAVTVPVNNGLFTVVVGDTNLPNMSAIATALFAQPNLQLQIWFNDGTHGFAALNPAQSLTPAPYADYAAIGGSVAATNIVGILPAGQLPASFLTNGASGVTITGTLGGNGAGVTNVPGTLAQVVVSSTTFTAQANTAYDLTNSTEVSVTLPTNANVGDLVQVTGSGTGGWQVTGCGIGYWTAQTGAPTPAQWNCVASSADGTHLVAVAYGGGIYTSANSGVTWTEQNGAPTSAYWYSVASSADGTHLVAVEFGGGIYTSTDSGVTWTEQTSAPTPANWGSVASSADGTRLVATVYIGGVYTSTNSGITWKEQTGAPTTAYWVSAASSSDGTHLVAVEYGNEIYTSTDSGVTWTAQPGAPLEPWSSVASSADGTHLVAVTYEGDGIFTSPDSGVTWTQQTWAPISAYWYAVASSADGTQLAAVGLSGEIYTSADSGATWAEQTSAPTSVDWNSVASSADGTHLVAVVYGGGIYTTAINGVAGTSEQFQYLGNGVWQPLPPFAGYPSNHGSTVQALNGDAVNFATVGIASTSPAALLEIQGGADGSGANDQHDIALAYRKDGYRHWIRSRHSASFTANPTDNAIDFYVNNSIFAAGSSAPGSGNLLTLSLNGGHVGIANAEPSHLLVVGSAGSPAYCDGTTWQNGSDRNSKEAFSTINPRTVLDEVSALPISEWQYKVEAGGTRHLGPVAQDFHAAFGLNGADDTHIATIDEEGVALAAIQGLNEKVEGSTRQAAVQLTELQAENARLKTQNEILAARLNDLEGAVKAIARKK